MIGWPPWSWTDVSAAVAAGLVLCELNLLLTSAVLHRGMAHRAVVYPHWLERLVCAWAWLTVFARPLSWIAAHRHHHAHADTAEDPHAPGRAGAMHVVLFSWYDTTAWTDAHRALAAGRYLREFRGERCLRALDGRAATSVNFSLQLGLGLLHPLALGFLVGRLVPYMLALGYMNAAGHMLGARHYDNLGTDARGFWQTLAAWGLAGEPLGHNFHHRFPASPTFRPGGLDPGHWFATRILRGVPGGPASRPPGPWSSVNAGPSSRRAKGRQRDERWQRDER